MICRFFTSELATALTKIAEENERIQRQLFVVVVVREMSKWMLQVCLSKLVGFFLHSNERRNELSLPFTVIGAKRLRLNRQYFLCFTIPIEIYIAILTAHNLRYKCSSQLARVCSIYEDAWCKVGILLNSYEVLDAKLEFSQFIELLDVKLFFTGIRMRYSIQSWHLVQFILEYWYSNTILHLRNIDI